MPKPTQYEIPERVLLFLAEALDKGDNILGLDTAQIVAARAGILELDSEQAARLNAVVKGMLWAEEMRV